MPILSAYIVPHPPLIIPQVGSGREAKIQRTIDSYHKVAKAIAQERPETIIIISPHSVGYADYFHISGGDGASGSMARFGAPQTRFSVDYDQELAAAIEAAAKSRGIPAGTQGGGAELDHGTTVPLYFIDQYFKDYKLVRMSVSGFDLETHFEYGVCVREAVGEKRVAVVASGDLSHRLKADGPYDFNGYGPIFDKGITDAMAVGDFNKFFEFDETTMEAAGECGLRGFCIMAGILDELPVDAQFYSYEGPFGVGYGVCAYKVLDFCVYLAKLSLTNYLEKGEYMECPRDLPEGLEVSGRGAFVSLKKNGVLRGCIGTITGVQDNLALEIIANAVSAGTRDPRFNPVTLEELEELECSVDVLFAPEPIEDISALDPKEYGVIVSCGHRRGLLLPNLEGIDTAVEQVAIAMQKGGIHANEDYRLERFRVVRHK